MSTRYRSNLKADQLKKLIKLKEDSVKWAEVLKQTGLSHSKAECAWMEHEAFTQQDPPFKVLEPTPANVIHLRTALGLGWGPIGVWCQVSEGQVRKVFKLATGTHSDGQRIGRGGRFKFDDAELYVGELKPSGTSIPATERLVREVAHAQAFTQRLSKMEFNEVKAVYEAYAKVKAPKNTTKAKLIIALAKLNNERVGASAPTQPSKKVTAVKKVAKAS